MSALGRNPAYSVVLMLRATQSNGRHGIDGPEHISELMIDGGASTLVKAGRSVGDLNGDIGVFGEGGKENAEFGEDGMAVMCDEIKMELVFEAWATAVNCLIFAFGVSRLGWGIVRVSFCSTRFGKAR